MAITASSMSTRVDAQQNVGSSHNDGRVNFYYDSNTTTELFNKTLGPVAGRTLTLAGFIAETPVIEHHFREFNKWLKDNQGTAVIQEFEKLHDHKLLKEFLDPRTNKVMLDPVRTPMGEIFDQSTLKALSQLRTDGKVLDSASTTCFTLQQVEAVPAVLAKLKATYTKLIGQINPSSAVETGLQILIKELHRNVNNFVAKEMYALIEDLKSDKITMEQFADRTCELIGEMNPSV